MNVEGVKVSIYNNEVKPFMYALLCEITHFVYEFPLFCRKMLNYR